MDVLTSSFPRQAASASLFAPFLSLLIGLFLEPLVRGNRAGILFLGVFLIVLLTIGFIMGVVAMVRSSRYRSDGIFANAVGGVLFSGLFVVGMFFFLPMMLASCPPTPALTGKPATPRPPGNSARPGPATSRPALAAYDFDGIRFSYDRNWTVTDVPEFTNAATGFWLGRVVEVAADADEDTGILIASIPFNAARAYPSLEVCAQWLVFELTGATNSSVAQITGNLGGARVPGVSLRCIARKKDGTPWIGVCDFLLVENPKRRVIVGTLWPANADRSALSSALASFKIEGMNDVTVAEPGDPSKPHLQLILYTPTRATALIANKTVMAGDVVEGYQVVAIGREWVSVQSPDGVKKRLRIGDSLEQ